jgi:hypothetical protein
VLDILNITAPPQLDVNFDLTVEVTADTDDANAVSSFQHEVLVLARADPPAIRANNIALLESVNATLELFVNHSINFDGSKTVSLQFTVQKEGISPIGKLSASSTTSVLFSEEGDGVYILTASGVDAQSNPQSVCNSFWTITR